MSDNKSEESKKFYDKLLQEFGEKCKPTASKKSIQMAKKIIFETASKQRSWRGGQNIYSVCNGLDKNVFKDTKDAGHFTSEIYHFRRKQAFKNFTSLLQECNLSANADYDDFHLKCRKDIRLREIDEPIDRQKLFHKFLKDLTIPEDSVRERKEVQEEDKEEVEASQQEKHKELLKSAKIVSGIWILNNNKKKILKLFSVNESTC